MFHENQANFLKTYVHIRRDVTGALDLCKRRVFTEEFIGLVMLKTKFMNVHFYHFFTLNLRYT